jgi:hypothetical protein
MTFLFLQYILDTIERLIQFTLESTFVIGVARPYVVARPGT